MDELVHHCLRELSFDGDLGCNISRLRDFIAGFYEHNPGLQAQVVDDAFYAFIWSIIVQQSTIRIGTIPSGITSEVYVAPQISAKRKAKAKGEGCIVEAAPRLDILPDAKTMSLDELKALYGDSLRIAVDAETLFAAITGSHLRPPKLSPMVYTALQFITRGRENGISVIELGKQSKYDQKTCFYLIKQLVELDLVLKVRRGGVGSHFCIHKYFFERSELWQQIRDEERKADEVFALPEEHKQQVNVVSEGNGSAPTLASTNFHFDPIDARHLSSLSLVRARVVKLLKASKNYLHAYNNMLLTIGFSNPTKTDRRFFSTRIRELIQQGVVEKVAVPNNKKDNSVINCLRLIIPDTSETVDKDALAMQPSNIDDETDLTFADTQEQTGVKMNATIHKQVSDLLEEAGCRGMTLNEISCTLGSFDKRTIELLLTRAEKYLPPSHLSDLGTAELMETYGRERRHRYYTVASFQSLIAQENLDERSTSYTGVDFSGVGGFASVDPSVFYNDEHSLNRFRDDFKDKDKDKNSKIKRAPNSSTLLSDGTIKLKKSRKKPEKKSFKPTDDDERLKIVKRGSKRKRVDDDAGGAPDDIQEGVGLELSQGVAAEVLPKAKRGRPPKKRRIESGRDVGGGEAPVKEVKVPKRRGRPRKVGPSEVIEADNLEDSRIEVMDDSGFIAVDHDSNAGTVKLSSEKMELPAKRARTSKRSFPASEPSTEQVSPLNTGIIPPEPTRSAIAGTSPKSLDNGDSIPDRATSGHDFSMHPDAHIQAVQEENVRETTEVTLPSHSVKPRRSLRTPKPTVGKDNLTLLQRQTRKKPRITRSSVPATSPRKAITTEDRVADVPQEADSIERLSPEIASLSTQSTFVKTTPPLGGPRTEQAPSDALPLRHPSAAPALRADLVQLDCCIPIDPVLTTDGTDTHGPLNEALLPPVPLGGANEPAPLKRGSSGGAQGTPHTVADIPAVQTTKGARAKVNVSQLRRENELYHVIEGFGGIVNIHTKEFFEAHMALITATAEFGEPTSAPVGTRLDKRTADATLITMENKGRLKLLKTSVITPTGASRPACVAYLANMEQDKVNAFLADLSRSVPTAHPSMIKKIEERLDYGSDQRQSQRYALPLQLLHMEQPGNNDAERWSMNATRAQQLFSYDDATVREVLLAERTTMGQLYGFIVGKARRARELHLSTLARFEHGDPSSGIVSQEQRIVHISYYYEEISLATYCSLISSLVYTEELSLLLETEEGRNTPVRDIPPKLHSLLQIGRARARARFLDLLGLLRSLKIVTPLTPSTSDVPWTTCSPNGEYPTAFDVASFDDWSSITPVVAPVFWHFNTKAPLHLWVLSETSPPFWKETSVATSSDADAYWRELQYAFSDRQGAETVVRPLTGTDNSGFDDTLVATRTLRRAVSWNPNYILTWHQSRYLKKYVDGSTGRTPLQEDDAEAQIKKISWITSAPQEVIRKFFAKAHAKVEHELEKARRKKAKSMVVEEKAKIEAIEAKAHLAKKAAEAKLQREKDWDEIIHRLHPEPLKGSVAIRVRRVRSQFLQSSSAKGIQKWEEEIAAAIREASLATTTLVKRTSAPKIGLSRIVPPPVVSNPPEKSIEILIKEQGPALHQKLKVKKKSKGKGKNDTEEGPAGGLFRRHRFIWTRDYDELARDASAIIKARCRSSSRIDLAALEQVFPGVPRNSVRQRLAHMRETPITDAYLKRLEDQWHELWLLHRGTDLLPDDDPESPSNFDLIKHIEFLRKHIDKNALRVGFRQVNESSVVGIPATIDGLLECWDVVETASTLPLWDFMWNTAIEEGREKSLLRQAFTTSIEEMPLRRASHSDNLFVAESALKMVFGTPNESYDPDTASQLLYSVGESEVSVATSNLLDYGVLSKVVRDPQKSKPGRRLKISEINQNAIGGSIGRDVYQDASALDEIASGEGYRWREWPLLASDGDMAALIQYVSEEKVIFKIDISQPRAARTIIDWSSKKADDDQIESAIHVCFCNWSSSARQSVVPMTYPDHGTIQVDGKSQVEHGKNVTGDPACCRTYSEGPIDCLACLDAESNTFIDNLIQEDREVAHSILKAVRSRALKGITQAQLCAELNVHDEGRLFFLVRQMICASVPLLFQSGYAVAVLVSAEYLDAWTVIVSRSPMARVFPRRWLDITGAKMSDVWEAALKAVVGVLCFRPGILETELRWRLRSVYDRQEIDDVLRYLEEEGYIQRRHEMHCSSGAVHDETKGTTFWIVGDVKHWYQV